MWKPICFFFFALMTIAASASQTGFKQFSFTDVNKRVLEVAVWYPTHTSGPEQNVGGNQAFIGVPVLKDASPAAGRHPLLLLSHGYGGSWRNLNWLAQELAAQGYIVAGPDHPGTTTHNRSPDEAAKLWLRPEDLNQLINRLLHQRGIAGEVDDTRIAAIGHSLGGWTVMTLAGAQFDPGKFINDCRQHPHFSDCQLISTLGIDASQTQAKLRSSLRNPHIKAVVSLDLGLARGFTQDSLAAIHIPVLVLSAQQDSPELPATLESGYLAQFIAPQWVTFTRIAGATHFSFMQLCQPGAQALIEAASPGDGIVCQDEPGAVRQDIHRVVMNAISDFLKSALNAPADGTPLVSFR